MKEDRLYDPLTNQPGRGFTPPPNEYPNTDLILPLTTEETNKLIDEKTLPEHVQGQLSMQNKRGWILEKDVNEVNFVVILTKGKVLRLYQVMKPT